LAIGRHASPHGGFLFEIRCRTNEKLKIFANFASRFPEKNEGANIFAKKRKIRDCSDPN